MNFKFGMDYNQFVKAIDSKMAQRTEETANKLLGEIADAFNIGDVKVVDYSSGRFILDIYGGDISLDIWPWLVKNITSKLTYSRVSSMKFADSGSLNIQVCMETNTDVILESEELSPTEMAMKKFLQKKNSIIQEFINAIIGKVNAGDFEVVGNTTDESFRQISVFIKDKEEYGDAEIREALRALYAYYGQKQFSYKVNNEYIEVRTTHYAS